MNERMTLIRNASEVYTGNLDEPRLSNVDILIKNNQIAAIGHELDGTEDVAVIVNADGKIVTPGLINTHDHSSQTFMRGHPDLQNQPIKKWIAKVGELSQKMDPEAHHLAALANMAELMLSGCTTTTDMLYVYPKKYDDQELFEAAIEAATMLGMRFHPFRGSMSLSQKNGASFGDYLVQTSEEIAGSTEDSINTHHDESDMAVVKVGIAPCTIFTSSEQDYQNAVELAGLYNVNLQTHLAESEYEHQYALKKYSKSPLQFLQSLGWDTDRVSFVHCIEMDDHDIGLLVAHNCSVCHCPISNARAPVGQKGIAPISEMLKVGVNVSIGVDGSAGNDSSNMLEEMRWARTMQGAKSGSTYLSADKVLYMATMGGAKALRWQDTIGSIEPGKAADIAIFDVHDSVGNVGVWDKIGGLVSTQARRADTVIVNGKIVVSGGQLVSMDEKEIVDMFWGKWKEVFEK